MLLDADFVLVDFLLMLSRPPLCPMPQSSCSSTTSTGAQPAHPTANSKHPASKTHSPASTTSSCHQPHRHPPSAAKTPPMDYSSGAINTTTSSVTSTRQLLLKLSLVLQSSFANPLHLSPSQWHRAPKLESSRRWGLALAARPLKRRPELARPLHQRRERAIPLGNVISVIAWSTSRPGARNERRQLLQRSAWLSNHGRLPCSTRSGGTSTLGSKATGLWRRPLPTGTPCPLSSKTCGRRRLVPAGKMSLPGARMTMSLPSVARPRPWQRQAKLPQPPQQAASPPRPQL